MWQLILENVTPEYRLFLITWAVVVVILSTMIAMSYLMARVMAHPIARREIRMNLKHAQLLDLLRDRVILAIEDLWLRKEITKSDKKIMYETIAPVLPDILSLKHTSTVKKSIRDRLVHVFNLLPEEIESGRKEIQKREAIKKGKVKRFHLNAKP